MRGSGTIGAIFDRDAAVLNHLKNGKDVYIRTTSLIEKERKLADGVGLRENATVMEESRFKHGDKSYYYFDVKKGPDAAPSEAPQLLKTRQVSSKEQLNFHTISAYSWEDDGALVK